MAGKIGVLMTFKHVVSPLIYKGNDDEKTDVDNNIIYYLLFFI